MSSDAHMNVEPQTGAAKQVSRGCDLLKFYHPETKNNQMKGDPQAG